MLLDIEKKKTKASMSRDVTIYIAGDYERAKETCRKWCDKGGCVSIWKADYIYTGGEESGLVVRLINYPRFDKTSNELIAEGLELGEELMVDLHQTSFSVVGPLHTFWVSRRKEN
jgi:hypothetical protein